MASYGMACYDCGSHDCDGCREVEEERDPNMETLATSPEGMGLERMTEADALYDAMIDADLAAQRERNLQRWGLRPAGKGIEVRKVA